jgi:adenylylsulfate kinase-like enzyme
MRAIVHARDFAEVNARRCASFLVFFASVRMRSTVNTSFILTFSTTRACMRAIVHARDFAEVYARRCAPFLASCLARTPTGEYRCSEK